MIGLYIYQAALLDFFRFKRTFGWILISIVVGIASYAYLQVTGASANEDYARLSLMFVYRLLPLAAAIYSVAVINQEVTQKTIVYLVTRPVSRATLILARSAAAMTVSFVLSVVCLMCVAFAVYHQSFFQYAGFWNDVVALAIGSCAYVSMFVLVSLLINRAMIVILLYAFGLEMMTPRMNGDLFYLSIGSYLTAIAQKPMVSSGNPLIDTIAGLVSSSTLTTKTAWPILILIVVGCMCAAAWWFTHFEYVPREDVE
jgi:ABC-2 type transport system permease protein